MRGRDLQPPLPDNPTLGTVWVSEDALIVKEDGTVDTIPGMAEGCIWVQHTCTECRENFKGWMFVHEYDRQKDSLETRYVMGQTRWCDRCVTTWEHRREIADLEHQFKQAHRLWRSGREAYKKMPSAKVMERTLAKLLKLIRFGSGRFAEHSNQLDVIQVWITQHGDIL